MENQNDKTSPPARKKQISLKSPLITAVVAVVAIGGLLAYPVYRAYQSGKYDAQLQWQKGQPTIIYVQTPDNCRSTSPDTEKYCYLDFQTALPLEIAQPAEMNLKLKAYVAGYNITIKQLIAQKGNPANSYKPWIDQITNPKKYFADSKTKPTILSLNGPRQPFGKGSARLMKNSIPDQPPKLDVTIDGKLYLIPLKLQQMFYSKIPENIELLPGPPDTTLVFFRATNSDSKVKADYIYKVFDAKTGKCLRVE